MYKEIDFLVSRKYFLSKKHHRVYDFGGRKYYRQLKELGYNISKGKTSEDKVYDVVLCLNELCELSCSEERRFFIDELWKIVDIGGFLYISLKKGCEFDFSDYIDFEDVGFIEHGREKFEYFLVSKKSK